MAWGLREQASPIQADPQPIPAAARTSLATRALVSLFPPTLFVTATSPHTLPSTPLQTRQPPTHQRHADLRQE